MTQRSDALAPGYELDRYQIERLLGEGGFGITYLAKHIHTGKPVAIKEYLPSEFALRESNSTVLPRGGKSVDAYHWGLARFMDEAKTLETFAGHPNIVVVRDFFEANGTAYLVMQYEEGQTFGQWLADHPHPSEQQLLDIFIPILDGLREVHSKQFLHRDIKPGNIYLRTNGTPLLIDFGSSRQALGEHSKSLSVVLTEGYAAKEQYSKRGNQGAWTDIYAVGATLWRAISGTDPEPAPDRGEARDNGHPDPLRPAVEVGRGRYAEDFLKAIDWALAYDPQNRPQTVREWQNLLLKNQNTLKPSPKPIPQPPPPPPPNPTPSPIPKPVPIPPPSGIGKWLGIASGILVLAGGGYWLGQSDTPQPSVDVIAPVYEQQAAADADATATDKAAADKAAAAKALELARQNARPILVNERTVGSYGIQLAASADKAKAEAVAAIYKAEGYKTSVVTARLDGKAVYRAVVGGYADKETASAAQAKMKIRFPQSPNVQNSFVTKQ